MIIIKSKRTESRWNFWGNDKNSCFLVNESRWSYIEWNRRDRRRREAGEFIKVSGCSAGTGIVQIAIKNDGTWGIKNAWRMENILRKTLRYTRLRRRTLYYWERIATNVVMTVTNDLFSFSIFYHFFLSHLSNGLSRWYFIYILNIIIFTSRYPVNATDLYMKLKN